MLFILTQTSFFPHKEVDFFRVRNPVGIFFNFIKLILPGPGFEPVASRVAGRVCPCILSHLTQVILTLSFVDIILVIFDPVSIYNNQAHKTRFQGLNKQDFGLDSLEYYEKIFSAPKHNIL